MPSTTRLGLGPVLQSQEQSDDRTPADVRIDCDYRAVVGTWVISSVSESSEWAQWALTTSAL